MFFVYAHALWRGTRIKPRRRGRTLKQISVYQLNITIWYCFLYTKGFSFSKRWSARNCQSGLLNVKALPKWGRNWNIISSTFQRNLIRSFLFFQHHIFNALQSRKRSFTSIHISFDFSFGQLQLLSSIIVTWQYCIEQEIQGI